MYKLLILDLDGTLIDSRLDIANATNYALSTLGFPTYSTEIISGFIGHGMTELLGDAFQTKDPKIIERGIKLFRDYYQAHCTDNTFWYPTVLDSLCALKNKITLTLFTNKPHVFTDPILSHLKAEHFFQEVATGGDKFPKKPDPSGGIFILKKLGLRPDEALFVGDSLIDIHAARNMGVHMALATYGLGYRNDCVNEKVDYRLKQFGELLKVLELC